MRRPPRAAALLAGIRISVYRASRQVFARRVPSRVRWGRFRQNRSSFTNDRWSVCYVREVPSKTLSSSAGPGAPGLAGFETWAGVTGRAKLWRLEASASADFSQAPLEQILVERQKSPG